MGRLQFENLYFGKASAEVDAADRDRFLRTFYYNIRQDIINSRDKFLIIGPKGSGKTALNEYIKAIIAKHYGDHALFEKTLNLEEVSPSLSPLSAISQKLVSDKAVGLTDSAWRLYFALRLFELIMRDPSCWRVPCE